MIMSAAIGEIIAERWIEETLRSYPKEMHSILGGNESRFRNPAGHVIKESLRTLAHELLGNMDRQVVATAIDLLVRLRAVQDFSPSAALGFIFVLRPIVAEVSGAVQPQLDRRIDELALMAFDRYMECREQIAGIREKEFQRRAHRAAQ
jgi:hypothetical protein